MSRIEFDADFDKLERDILKASVDIENGVLKRLEAEKGLRVNEIKDYIQRFVYQVYGPRVYRRNLNLLRAVNVTVEAKGTKGKGTIDFVLFNDTSQIPRTRPVGGARPEEVPWQIELGQYPDVEITRRKQGQVVAISIRPWLGPTAPRPAYLYYTQFLEQDIPDWTVDIIDEALS